LNKEAEKKEKKRKKMYMNLFAFTPMNYTVCFLKQAHYSQAFMP